MYGIAKFMAIPKTACVAVAKPTVFARKIGEDVSLRMTYATLKI